MKTLKFFAWCALALGLLAPVALEGSGPPRAIAQESTLVGVWKLKAFSRKEAETGKVTVLYGDAPKGVLIRTKGGHYAIIGFSTNRTKPAAAAATDEEAAKLFKSMFVHSGTYELKGSDMYLTPTMAWNETNIGVPQRRIIKFVGNELHAESPPMKSPVDGVTVVFSLVWERIE